MHGWSWPRQVRLASLCMALILPLGAAAADVLTVRYPAFESSLDPRSQPYVDLLVAALERTEARYGKAQVQPSALRMNEARYLLELELGTVDVIWSSATEEREARLLPVRIPLEKGLLGYRIAWITADSQPLFDRVQALDDLRRFRVGQGRGWGDIDVYKYNRIGVFEAGYNSLFAMLAQKRFDLFPRGVSEIYSEQDHNAAAYANLAVEDKLLFYYPWPYYFFFNRKTGAALAARVEEGLRLMIDDGSFDAMFQRHYAQAIQRANLQGRRLILLDNPMLPRQTPLNDARLWYKPSSARRLSALPATAK